MNLSDNNNQDDSNLTPWQKQNQEYLKKKQQEAEAQKKEEADAEARWAQVESAQNKTKIEDNVHYEESHEQEDKRPKVTRKKRTRRKNKNRRFRRQMTAIVIVLVIGILLIVFYLSPYSKPQNVTVVGNEEVSTDEIVSSAKINRNKNLLMQYYNKKAISDNILKGNPRIKSAEISTVGTDGLKIEVVEFAVVAYNQVDKSYYPVLENGYILEDAVKKRESGLPILVDFEQGDVLDQLLVSFEKIPSSVKKLVKNIKPANIKRNPNLVTLTMTDGNEVLASIVDMDVKMKYYTQIASMMNEVGVIDMEVGVYSAPFEEEEEDSDSSTDSEDSSSMSSKSSSSDDDYSSSSTSKSSSSSDEEDESSSSYSSGFDEDAVG